MGQDGLKQAFPLSAALTATGSASCWALPGVGSSPTEEQKRQGLADYFVVCAGVCYQTYGST